MTILNHNNMHRDRNRSGQAIIFLLVVLVVGLVALLWNFDLHKVVSSKMRVENAADAGALAGARWQGITLNMVGELNLIQAAVLCENPDDGASASQIAELRDRLAMSGPIMGYFAAQQMAALNLRTSDIDSIDSTINEGERIRDRADRFITSAGSYRGLSEPYPNAWVEYGNLLAQLGRNDMVLMCDNADYFMPYRTDHFLFGEAFYEAIRRSDWCWFELTGNSGLLSDYTGHSYWSPLPLPEPSRTYNGEYFSTDIMRLDTELNRYIEFQGANMANDYEIDVEAGGTPFEEQAREHVETNSIFAEYVDSSSVARNWPIMATTNYPWHFYDNESWMGRWPTADEDGFPYRNSHVVRHEYDYIGADVAVETRYPVTLLSTQIAQDEDEIIARSSAKSFGYLEFQNAAGPRQPPHYFGLVLPAFHDVRLVSGAVIRNTSDDSASDAHIYDHLPLYMDSGVSGIDQINCSYCRALVKWEGPNFRAGGELWLSKNADRCIPPEPPRLPDMGERTPRPGNGGGTGADTSGSGGTTHRR